MVAIKKILAAGATAAMGVSVLAIGSANATTSDDSTVSASVTAGVRSVSLTDTSFAAVPYSFNAQSQDSAAATLAISDLTGSNSGWQVTIDSTALSGAGGSIPKTNLAVVAPGALTYVAGQDTTGIEALASTTPFTTGALALYTAQANEGAGSYTNNGLTFRLNIPGSTAAGSYSGTVTTTIGDAP